MIFSAARYVGLCVATVLIASCGIPIGQSQLPIRSFDTSAEYLKEGKSHFDAGRFAEAQRYLIEAIRLDGNNQSALVLAGVTWAKLGNAKSARREFQKAIEINADGSEAITANSWLTRLERPLGVAILPFDNLGRYLGYNVESLSYQSLYKSLLASGLYSIVDERQLGYPTYPQGSRQARACQVAAGRGARIAILGTINDFQLVSVRPPPIYIRNFGDNFFAVALRASVQLYVTSGCRLVETFVRAAARNQIQAIVPETALNQIVGSVTQQLASDIHATLM